MTDEASYLLLGAIAPRPRREGREPTRLPHSRTLELHSAHLPPRRHLAAPSPSAPLSIMPQRLRAGVRRALRVSTHCTPGGRSSADQPAAPKAARPTSSSSRPPTASSSTPRIPPPAPPASNKSIRSVTGCSTCKWRKVKCDEQRVGALSLSMLTHTSQSVATVHGSLDASVSTSMP